jgi:hypothetical protein
MSSQRRRGLLVVAITCLAGILLALPALASAATGKYPPEPAARGFDGGTAGWTASSTFDGACLAPLLCPTVTNSHQPSAGADGGGYIQSDLTGVVGVMAVGGTATAVWQSPPFTYDDEGAAHFEMDRRANVDQLLAVAGNSATYSVRLVDVSAGGETTALTTPTSLAGANTWRNAPPATLDAGQLVSGHDYRILITTTYVTGTSVLVTGSADYDNVLLRAGDGGARGDGGSTGADQRLLDLLRGVTPGAATLSRNGKRLLVRVKCPRKAGKACRITTQGLLRKGKPATTKRTVRVRQGKAKLVPLKVKPKARDKVAKRKRLLVRQKVRAGGASAVLYKKRKLIRR